MDPNAYKEVFASSYADDLEPIVKLLAVNGIEGKIYTEGTDYNPSFVAHRAPDAVKLAVTLENFEAAQAILIANGLVMEGDDEMGLRQMLGDLDDEELLEMIADERRQVPDQVAMARKLLQERGHAPEPTAIAAKTEAITAEERKPKTIATANRILLGFLFFLIPLLGIAGGLVVITFRGTDARGDKYWLYSNTDRIIFGIVGVCNFVIYTTVYAYLGILGFL
jgi:hypothetical protein